MIDSEVFSKAFALICERFNRDVSLDLSGYYHREISERMDTEQFRAACKRILNTGHFFPSPEDFWGGASNEAAALDQWDLCQRVMEGEWHILDHMSPAGQRVVALLGGPSRLGQTPPDSIPFVRKEFLAMYGDIPEPQALLPEVTPESRRIVGEVLKDMTENAK